MSLSSRHCDTHITAPYITQAHVGLDIMDKQPNYKGNGDSELLKLQDSLLEKESFRHNARSASDSSVKMVDSVLAKEFSNLTLEERSKTYEELHGVDDSVEETPEFVQNMLLQLDNELEKLVTDSEAYRVAMAQDPAYVRSVKFRLCFLRCTGFHPEKAAARLLAFLEGKLKYFGRELLTKRIQFHDLDRDDRACAKGGHMQILASRDRSGRAVFVDINMMQDESFKTPMNRLKAFLYFWLAMAEDEENQKRGVVLLSMQMGSVDPTSVNKELWREVMEGKSKNYGLATATMLRRPLLLRRQYFGNSGTHCVGG